MLRQPVAGDGNCLFRSVAISFAHVFFGARMGNGVASTLAVEWLRYMTAHLLFGGPDAVREAERKQRRTLPHALFEVVRAMQAGALGEEARRRLGVFEPQTLVGRLRPDIVVGSDPGVPIAAALEEGVDQRAYCQQMLRSGTWGGDLEIIALFALLRLPIAVYSEQGKLMARHGRKVEATLRVVWCANGHYDALLEEDREPLVRIELESGGGGSDRGAKNQSP